MHRFIRVISPFITGTSSRICVFFPGDHHFFGAQVSVLDRGISILFSPEMTVNNLEDRDEKNDWSKPDLNSFGKNTLPSIWETRIPFRIPYQKLSCVFYRFYPPLNHKENRSSFNETRVLKCGLLASIPPDSVDLGFPFVDVSMIQTPKLDMWKPERWEECRGINNVEWYIFLYRRCICYR